MSYMVTQRLACFTDTGKRIKYNGRCEEFDSLEQARETYEKHIQAARKYDLRGIAYALQEVGEYENKLLRSYDRLVDGSEHEKEHKNELHSKPGCRHPKEEDCLGRLL